MTSADRNSPELSSAVAKAFATVSANFDTGLDDPFPLYRELRKASPVMEGDLMERFGVPSIAGAVKDYPSFTIFRYHDSMAILRDAATFTSGFIMQGQGTFLGDFMITGMDGETHRSARGLLTPAFAPAVLKTWRTTLMESVIRDEFVAPLVPKRRAELIADMGLMFPIRVIYAVIGLPTDRASIEKFGTWGLQILAGLQRDPVKGAAKREAAFRAAQEIYDYLLPIVARRRAEGAQGDDVLSRLIRAEYEGRSLTDSDITNIVRSLLPAAAETTTRTFGTMMTLLLERPELLERVRQNRNLIPRVIDEVVRYEPVATFKVRQASRDTEIGGVAIPKGSSLCVVVASANRDEEVFENSETFDIDRIQRPSFGFGFGPHMCIGLGVAKAELETALNAILDLMPGLRLDPQAPPPRIVGMQLRGPDALHVVWD